MNEKLNQLRSEINLTDYESLGQVHNHMQRLEALFPEMLSVDEQCSYQELTMMVNRIYRSMKAKAERVSS